MKLLRRNGAGPESGRQRRRKSRVIHCYAEGAGDRWEGFCLSFDLAVQGRSFAEVAEKLDDQIALYIEGISAMPAAERNRFWKRRVPLAVRLRIIGTLLSAAIRQRDDKARHEYSIPMGETVLTA
jgi:hypothetical protein